MSVVVSLCDDNLAIDIISLMHKHIKYARMYTVNSKIAEENSKNVKKLLYFILSYSTYTRLLNTVLFMAL